jgi:hypothetical protein
VVLEIVCDFSSLMCCPDTGNGWYRVNQYQDYLGDFLDLS